MFTNVAPQLTAYYSSPEWTNKGLLTFGKQTAQDTHAQIYLWDGKTATNISQNPTMHNGGQTWSTDGRWAFATYYSPAQLVYVRDADNKTILTVEGQYPAWSSTGYLTFCTFNSSDAEWMLSIWDGKQVSRIAQAGEIFAQWQNGARNVCSSG